MNGEDQLLRISALHTHLPAVASEVEKLLQWDGEGPGEALRRVVDGGEGCGSAEARRRARELLREHAPVRIRESASQRGLHLVFRASPEYPKRLRPLDGAPPVLYVRGRLPGPDLPSIAVVGSRAATQTGRHAAQTLAGSAACRGEVVVSGMAFGVDDAAHRGALAVGGTTVAVLASGADLPSPHSQIHLYRRIVAGGGAVLSQFLPGAPARPYRFPIRNWLIAALSDRVLVVEARDRSGALHTVDHAQSIGIPVLAYPGDGLSQATRGSNRLIQDGAEVVLGPEDLVSEGQFSIPFSGTSIESMPATGTLESGEHQKSAMLAHALADGPLPVDLLAGRLELGISGLRGALSRLERIGLVKVEGGFARWSQARWR
ncbi:MAG: DNA-protecting protein DprA [Gemmatimonadetes bacterium]|nr:DNA-protecting protein DprA [Gemmatimonadota bacterium]